MATYTLDELIDAIETTLSAAASLVRSQTYDELSEGMQDTPTLQVYIDENLGTDFTGNTDRATFGNRTTHKRHSFKEYVIIADYYANQRANIGEDMGRLVTGINELEDILDYQDYPLFGLSFVTSFRWSWKRVTFDNGGVDFVGARFRLIVRCGTSE